MLSPLLILLTWALWIGAITGLGVAAITLIRWRPPLRLSLLAGLWIGLALLFTLVAALNLVVPMGGALAQALAIVVLIGGWLLLIAHVFRHRHRVRQAVRRAFALRRTVTIVYITLVCAVVLLLANFATAEPMDYDTGLYRLGLINYSRDFSTIPGLANLHDRFGFNSALYPLAPFLETGVWQGQGFRLVAGLLVTVLATDLLLRVIVPRRRGAWAGDWYLVIGSAFLMALILTDSGRWIPSPAQDIAAYVPAVASTAFLADALRQRLGSTRRAQFLNLALVTAAASGSIRPLGWLLAAVTAVVAGVLLLQGPSSAPLTRIRALGRLWPGAVIAGLLAGVMLIRDALLTGWLLFPASILPLDVAWRLPDPSGASMGITSWGRAPGMPANEVLADSAWLGPWLETFARSREMYLIGLIFLLGVVTPLLWRRGRQAWRRSWRPILITAIPSAVYVLAWFITAPDVRFGWAGLIAISAVPLAWLLANKAFPAIPVRAVGLVILVVMLGTQVANNRVLPRGSERVDETIGVGPWAITVQLAPPQAPPTQAIEFWDGTPALAPITGENCWEHSLCVSRLRPTPGSVDSARGSKTASPQSPRGNRPLRGRGAPPGDRSQAPAP